MKQLFTTFCAAVLAACGLSVFGAFVSVDGVNYEYVYDGTDGDWDNLANWKVYNDTMDGAAYTDAGTTNSDNVATAGANPPHTGSSGGSGTEGKFVPTLLDGSRLSEEASKTVTVAYVEGWATKIGVYNGMTLNITKLQKFQSNALGTKWLHVDDSSKIVVNSFGGGTVNNDCSYYVASADGIDFQCNFQNGSGISHYFYLTGEGSVNFAGNVGGSLIIKQADFTLTETGNGRAIRYKKLIGTGGTNKGTASLASDATITCTGATATNDVSLSTSSVLGAYTLATKTDGVYLAYVDRADYVEFTGAADSSYSNVDNWSSGALPTEADELVVVSSNMTLDAAATFNELRIATNVTVTATVAASIQNLTGEGSYAATAGTSTIAAASLTGGIDIGSGATVAIAGSYVDCAVTGSGTLKLGAVEPDDSSDTSVRTRTMYMALKDASGWTGTVLVEDLAFTQLFPQTFGNASSVIEIKNSSGYLQRQFGNIDRTVKISGTVDFNAGWGGSSDRWGFKKLTGDGTLTLSANAAQQLKVADVSEFTGSIQVTGIMSFAVNASDYSARDTGIPNGYIKIAGSTSVTLPADQAWTASGWICDGTLTIADETLTREMTVLKGSGAIALNGGTLKIASASAYTGTITVASGATLEIAEATGATISPASGSSLVLNLTEDQTLGLDEAAVNVADSVTSLEGVTVTLKDANGETVTARAAVLVDGVIRIRPSASAVIRYWKGTGTNWSDTGAWTDATGADADYVDGAEVFFTNATATVCVNTEIAPKSILVDDNAQVEFTDYANLTNAVRVNAGAVAKFTLPALTSGDIADNAVKALFSGEGTVQVGLASEAALITSLPATSANFTDDFAGTLHFTAGQIKATETITSNVTIKVTDGAQFWLSSDSGTWYNNFVVSGDGYGASTYNCDRDALRIEATIADTATITFTDHEATIGCYYTGYVGAALVAADGFKVQGNTSLVFTRPTGQAAGVTGTIEVVSGGLMVGNNNISVGTSCSLGPAIQVDSGATLWLKLNATGAQNELSPGNKTPFTTEVILNGGTLASDDGGVVYSKVTVLADSAFKPQWNKGQVITELAGEEGTTLTFTPQQTGYGKASLAVKGGTYAGTLVVSGDGIITELSIPAVKVLFNQDVSFGTMRPGCILDVADGCYASFTSTSSNAVSYVLTTGGIASTNVLGRIKINDELLTGTWYIVGGMITQTPVVDSISINVTHAQTDGLLSSTDVAGAYAVPGSVWNQFTAAQGSAFSNRMDVVESLADGTTETGLITADLTGHNTYSASGHTTVQTGNGKLAYGYIDDGENKCDSTKGARVQIHNLPYASYTVYIYLGTDQDTGSFAPMYVNGTQVPADVTTWGDYSQVHESSDSTITWEPETNCLKVEDLNTVELDAYCLKNANGGSAARASIAGIQVVSTGVRAVARAGGYN